ncbi:type VI secretion system tip protein VgrG [Echinicola vietnamensis]|uniref:Rhs element Vgr protein n=1 Tax=Echinicola vietnamensis (strain DSM 17526 / LMG 23754 / KMM 6221) TaxID=926556 RepID=L0G3B7_ECHVK|nr:type VI secretion system tip protein VgrG [Echinicola vietnamensis]AGA79808.1 Rhs element Vgr protein [Echinicola vietnamensis DSM 17526]
MNNSGTISTSQSVDRVTHKILIDGEEIPGTYQVKSIFVSKEVNRIPVAKLAILDGDAAERDFKVSNAEHFIPGKELEITAGYHSDESTIFKGIIVKHNLKIRNNQSLLLVEAKDKAVKMTLRRKSKYFYEMSDGDILEELASAHNLETDIATTNTTHAEVVQYDVTDWDFMMLRAQANGLIAVVDDGKLTFQLPDLAAAEVETVTFGATVLEFDAEMDARTQVPKVLAKAWNMADQTLWDIEGNDPALSTNGNVPAGDLSGLLDESEVILRHGGNKKDTLLQDWADAKWKFQQMAKTRGRIKFQGIPEVKPGANLLLEGVGDRFNGKVFVSGICHQISEGNWTVDAQFGFDPTWFAESESNIHTPPASGLTAAISGLQVGIVTKLEEDPDGEDRIKVKIPIINNEEEGIWCRQACLDAGEERGVTFRPELDDEVVVGFINEDPNEAVILGMLHSSAKLSPIPGADDNHEKGIHTRSGIKFIFNDEKSSVLLETPGGNKILVDDDAGSITIEDQNGNTAVMDSSGITMEAAKDFNIKATGDLNLEGTNVNVKANAQFKAEGSAGAEVSTSAVAILKGSLVQIN